MNYFQLLGIEQKYDIEQDLLKKTYLEKQMEYHPDRASSNELKVQNIEVSMLLNEAFKVLGDDYKRAEYLLKLNGFDLSDERLNSKLAPEELESILEEYEKIEEIQSLQKLQQEERQKLESKGSLIVMLTERFRANDFAKALEIAVRLKYLTNLVGNIKLKIKNANNRD